MKLKMIAQWVSECAMKCQLSLIVCSILYRKSDYHNPVSLLVKK